MKLNKNQIMIIVFSLAVILISAFVFYHSFKDNQSSHVSSGMISDIIVPNETMNESVSDVIVDIGKQMPDIQAGAEWVSPKDIVEAIIRKIAHIIEYAALGFAVMGLVLAVRAEYGRLFLGWAFFYVLAVAVTDEYIQSFSDRSSSIGDVLLDFSGALIGFAAVLLVYYVIVWIKRRRSGKRKAVEPNS